ncbi:MAG: LTA synthase family protein [Clostridia bacterium]|nr:LTA synthase family protein [Clostridia bacterium]
MKTKFASLKTTLFYFCFFFADIVFSELCVRFFTLGFDGGFPIFMPLFAIGTSMLTAAICSVLGKKARTAVSFLFAILLFIIYIVQLVYHTFCDSFMSVVQIAMGGDALTRFGEAAVFEIIESLGGIMLLLVPALVLLVLSARGIANGEKALWKMFFVEIALFICLHFGAVACLPLGGTQLYSPYDIYHDTFVLGMSERYFGVLTSLRLEVRGLVFGTEKNELITSEVTEETEAVTTTAMPSDIEIPVIEYDYNITDIDFAALAAAETNEDARALHEYFATQSGTKQNEYTGMFEGYNLILICAESLSPYVIDEERTPTLYKMASEGFRFTDYYNTICDNTSNGEYAILTGLLPDTSLLGKGWKNFYSYNSFTVSQENAFPFCLGNQLSALGYQTFAVHNYYYDYYGRHKTHPNMGYEFKAMYRGLKYDSDWPTSDVSMMEQSLPLMLTPDESGEIKPFHAYFLTFSGHMPYTFGSNSMADKNKAVTADLGYSSKVKSYIAAQQELEYALGYLLSELENAGVLDNTLIAITNDHYPYPLGLEGLSELAGKELNSEFDKYRSCFILWSASMEKSVTVDVPCCSLDILPTLSNLLGLEYDSRLMMGTDIFSEGEHIAILADRSFVTDKVMYNCTNGETTLRDGADELPEGYLDSRIVKVKNKFTLSTEMLYSDYYSKVYGE